MPDKLFLETYPLYRKFRIDELPEYVGYWPKANINMSCPICKSDQTFVMTNEYIEGGSFAIPSGGFAARLVYSCSHCDNFERLFYVKAGGDNQSSWYMKIGQYPTWEVTSEPNIEKLLGEHAGYYKKGLICESQGYGIGAFGYYRRIVEETIDELLSEITELLSGDELETYNVALEKTKQTRVTSEKIELVKDLLPAILKPDGMNPLSSLHSVLSQGLHAESDEVCLDLAETCREILVFLVNQISASKQSSKSFTDSMRKLLDKKAEKPG